MSAPAPDLNYESLFNRAVAALIDNAIWLFGTMFVLGFFPASAFDEHPEVIAVVLLAAASAWFNYFAICEWRWGQTIGKNAMGSRVLLADGSKAGFGAASIRNVVRIVDFLGIGPLMILSSEQRQRLGDKLAGTVVVRDAPVVVRGAKPAVAPAQGSGDGEASRAAGHGLGGRVTWGPAQTVWGLFAGLALSLFFAPLLIVPFDSDLSSLGARLAAQAMLALSLVGVALYVVRGPGDFGLRAALGRLGMRRFPFSALGTMLLALFVYYVAAVMFSALVLQPEQEDIGGDLGLDAGTLEALAAVFLIAVVAPFAEELFFRGFLFAGLRRRLSLWPAALISAAVFGGIHAPTGPTAVVPLAMLGVVFAWLYERTGSIWPCIIAHALNNGLALAVAT